MVRWSYGCETSLEAIRLGFATIAGKVGQTEHVQAFQTFDENQKHVEEFDFSRKCEIDVFGERCDFLFRTVSERIDIIRISWHL